MKITLTSPSVSGLSWIDIPAGAPWRRALDAGGTPVPCQFIPAPFDGVLAGRLLVRTAQKELLLAQEEQTAVFKPGCDWVSVNEGTLTLGLMGQTLPFHDRLLNGWSDEDLPFGYPKGNEAFEPVWGVFPLVSDRTQVTLLPGPLADVARLITPLTDQESGRSLCGGRACYDIVRFHNERLVQMLLCFTADEPAAMMRLLYGQLELPLHDCAGWRGGVPEISGTFDAAGTQSGFPPVSFLRYGAVRHTQSTVAYVGGYPLLQADGGTVRLRPDLDGANREGMGRDLREFGPGSPLAVSLYFPENDEDGAAMLARLPGYEAPEAEDGQEITLQAGALTARLRLTGHGVDLAALEDGITGESWLRSGGNELFTVLMRQVGAERQYVLSSLSGWEDVSALKGHDRLTLVFDRPTDPALSGVSVVLTASCDPSCNRISWEMDLQNRSDTVSLIQAEYPRLYYDATADTCVFDATGPGALLPQGGRLSVHKSYIYPTEQSAMPYLAVWRTGSGKGLYMGVHDVTGCYKLMRTELNAFTQRGYMLLTRPVEGIGEPANGCKAAGQGVWQLFSGDWYDAARIYRGWALPHANWIPPVDDEGRVTGSQWMKKAPFWFNISVDNPLWVEETLQAAQDLGVPVACHVYNWHQIPFDNDYPHYFPAKEEFLKKAPILQQAGLKLMPYINGRLWDMHDRLDEDYLFTAKGRAGATKGRAGKPVRESFLSREIDGTRVKHAVMCPSTAVWQETQRLLVERLFTEAGVDGVYIDQVAAAPPVLCMDTTHSHRPGGGSWWFNTYDHFFDHMRQAVPPERDGGFMIECSGEVYMGSVDGLLTWGWQYSRQVPAFSAVYGGYTTYWGRNYHASEDDIALRILGSQQLLFGDSMGWLSPRMYLNSPHRDLYRKMVRARYAHNDFYYAGHMERPPRITGADRMDTPLGLWGCPLPEQYMAVNAAIWQRNRDGARTLLITNIAGQAQDVEITLPQDGPLALSGDLNETVAVRGGRVRLTLPPYSVVTADF